LDENGNTLIAFISGIFLGAFVGAILALLYAPEAGESLRQKIQSGIMENWQKVNTDFDHLAESARSKISPSDEEEMASQTDN
jgi:gas vesicle protein